MLYCQVYGILTSGERMRVVCGGSVTAKVGTTTLEGYIAGRTAIEAARTVLKASGSVTRGKLREALAGLHTDFGGYRVEFAAGSTQGSRYVDLVTTDRFGRLVG